MQTGTTTFANLHPQTFSGGLLLRIKEMSELLSCVLGHGNHRPANYDLSPLKSKMARRLKGIFLRNQQSEIYNQQ